MILRHDDPWWQTHYPPNGWGCQCRVFAESRASAERKGYTVLDAAPAIELEQKLVGARSDNPQVITVPKGIDPGWDYAPGATRAAQVRTAMLAKATALPAPLGLALAESVVAPSNPPKAPKTKGISKQLGKGPPP